ncbi:MAG TPA: ATP-binding cassette domain-containing protein [Chromatiaceae bacterium]|nr:ATP-binding cassette domain-containing protein [Chromatiaceae bacterium]
MALLSFSDVSLAYGLNPLLDKVSFQLDRGERVCLIGRNGAGKSSLFRLVTGEQGADEGDIWFAPGLKIGQLPQELPAADDKTVYDVVASGLAGVGELLAEYHHLITGDMGDAELARLEKVQVQLEAKDGWRLDQLVDTTLTRLGLPADKQMSELSGGWRRRVLLAQALVAEPDVLLLDEPTNHLDIHTIAWLESVLLEFRGAVLFITHDRSFLQALATRILELDRGQLIDWQGDYRSFLEHKEQQLAAEATANALFDKKLAQEEVWIRQGIKARRTRNEGRVRKLQAMREAARQRRKKQGTATLSLNRAETSGKLVCEAENVSYAWDGQPIIRDFSTTILRGDRVGIIGSNGCGKSTLLNLLLGKLQPDSGQIKLGSKVEVAYFDQLRAQLDVDATVIDNVAGGSDTVTVNGRAKHIIGYLQDFLFPPARARQPVKSLSGGERNRLLLAKLFAKPANLLVMDEPTNDLDVETLELLEELLLDFQGTLLLVSHDRVFLDNVVTSSLVFEGNGQVNTYVGGYSDWLAQRKIGEQKESAGADTRKQAKPSAQTKASTGKLGYKEQRELDSLPGEIESLEGEREKLESVLSDPDLYRNEPAQVGELTSRMQSLGKALEEKYLRWDELEEKRLQCKNPAC